MTHIRCGLRVSVHYSTLLVYAPFHKTNRTRNEYSEIAAIQYSISLHAQIKIKIIDIYLSKNSGEVK